MVSFSLHWCTLKTSHDEDPKKMQTQIATKEPLQKLRGISINYEKWWSETGKRYSDLPAVWKKVKNTLFLFYELTPVPETLTRKTMLKCGLSIFNGIPQVCRSLPPLLLLYIHSEATKHQTKHEGWGEGVCTDSDTVYSSMCRPYSGVL